MCYYKYVRLSFDNGGFMVMKRYIIDFDGVVLDSQTKFDENMKGNTNFCDWNEYLNSIEWREFYRSCNEIDDAFSTLTKLHYLKKLKAILTTIHSFNEGQEKSIILREKGVHVPVVFVLPNQCKSFIYPSEAGVILVDDLNNLISTIETVVNEENKLVERAGAKRDFAIRYHSIERIRKEIKGDFVTLLNSHK